MDPATTLLLVILGHSVDNHDSTGCQLMQLVAAVLYSKVSSIQMTED